MFTFPIFAGPVTYYGGKDLGVFLLQTCNFVSIFRISFIRPILIILLEF